jgi:hypothetical protein
MGTIKQCNIYQIEIASSMAEHIVTNSAVYVELAMQPWYLLGHKTGGSTSNRIIIPVMECLINWLWAWSASKNVKKIPIHYHMDWGSGCWSPLWLHHNPLKNLGEKMTGEVPHKQAENWNWEPITDWGTSSGNQTGRLPIQNDHGLQKNNSSKDETAKAISKWPIIQTHWAMPINIWYLLMPLASKSGLGTHLVWDDIALAVEPCVGGAHHQWMDQLQAFLMYVWHPSAHTWLSTD